MLVHLFLIGTLKVLILHALHSGDICGEDGSSKKFTWHETVNEARCCEEKYCHAGFESVMCTVHLGASRCERCEGGYNPDPSYTSLGAKCILWRECDNPGLTVHTEGTDLKDRTCKCDVRSGSYNPNYRSKPLNPDYCKRKSCQEGTELQETGECSPCKVGFYKPDKRLHSCKPKTECGKKGLEIDTEKTTEFSKVEDVYCKNVTVLPGTAAVLTETSVIVESISSTTTFIPKVAPVKQTDGAKVYALGIGIPSFFILLLTILILCCIRRYRGKQHCDADIVTEMHNFPLQDVEKAVTEKELPRAEKQGIEHDETWPLNKSESNKASFSEQRVFRQPTECDEHATAGAYSSQKSEAQTFNRQITMDSGYDGNCSSENGSLHLSMSSEGMAEDLKATPTSSQPQSLPVPLQCDKCGKVEKPCTVYVINGANSVIQVGNQNHLHNTTDESGGSSSLQHEPCSMCEGSGEGDSPDTSIVEIERSGGEDEGERGGGEEHSEEEIGQAGQQLEEEGEQEEDIVAAGVHDKLLTRIPNIPKFLTKTNSQQSQADEGFESFYRTKPVLNSIA